MQKIKKQSLAFFLLLLFFSAQLFLFSNLSPALAEDIPSGNKLDGQEMFKEIGSVSYGEPNNPKDPRIIIVRVINVILSFLAVIFLVLVVIAGIQWMMSGGNQEKVKSSTGKLKASIIGLLIVTFAWAISFFVLTRLRALTVGVDYMTTPSIY